MNVYTRAEAVFLLLDPAKHKSGALITRPSAQGMQIVTGAIVTKQNERDEFVGSAKELAAVHDLPLIVIAEEWDPPRGTIVGPDSVNKRWTFPTVLGMGEGWGKWTAEFERHGVPELDVVRVTPNDWRDAVFGKTARPKEREELKKHAVKYIQQRMKMTLAEDIAEAACIGLWGLHAPAVHHRIEVWHHKSTRRRGA